MSISKEILVCGLVFVASGLSQIVASLTFVSSWSSSREIVGFATVVLGVVICVVGSIWQPKSDGRPLGLTIVAIDFVIGGILSLALAVSLSDLAGLLFFTLLGGLSLVLFTSSFLLLKGNFYGWLGAIVITFAGLVISVLGLNQNYVIDIPGVLGAIFFLWYLDRPQVTKYFGQNRLWIDAKKKHFVLMLVIALIALVPLSYYYVDPPSRTISFTTGGGGGGWVGSTDMIFQQGDVLNFNYVVTSGEPVTFEIGLGYQSPPIATVSGMSGSGEARIPVAGQYSTCSTPIGGSVSMLKVDITVKMFPVRAPLTQWALLDMYLIIASLFAVHISDLHRRENLANEVYLRTSENSRRAQE